jgi:hypothetical protein
MDQPADARRHAAPTWDDREMHDGALDMAGGTLFLLANNASRRNRRATPAALAKTFLHCTHPARVISSAINADERCLSPLPPILLRAAAVRRVDVQAPPSREPWPHWMTVARLATRCPGDCVCLPACPCLLMC